MFDRRYRGPLTSANGGYACGRLAAFVDAPEVEVTLRLPPPLGRPLEVRLEDGSALLFDGAALVAEAHPAGLELDVPPPISIDEAWTGRDRHVHIGEPIFAECFVCGTRDENDGLGVYVGVVPGHEPVHAAPVTFPESSSEVVWAAIDCPGAYAVGIEGRGSVVLGRMTARVDRIPAVGETCVAAAWPLGEDGRKLFAGTALFGENGELVARARQIWIAPH